MYVIGISALYHDSSVSLFKDGVLTFACEEEKFTGIKHDSSFPVKALNYMIKTYRIKKEEVECICFYEDPNLKVKRVKETFKKTIFKNPLFAIKSLINILQNRSEIRKKLKSLSDNVFFSKHHDSHLYYSSYSSPFKESLVVSIDGVGEYETTAMSYFTKGNKLDVKTISTYPHSIGLFYSSLTSFLGFKPNEGEYKVMGLSAYGKKTDLVRKLGELIWFDGEKIECNMSVFNWDKSNKTMFKFELSEYLGLLPRTPDSEITQEHMDLSYAVQRVYENIFLSLLKHLQKKYKTTNLCLGGGCAYNGLANGKIYESTGFKSVWIPPAPSDAGSSVGACVNYLVSNNKRVVIPQTPFIGPSFTANKNVRPNFNRFKGFHTKDDVIERIVAKELMNGKVIGWFKDEIEFGSRALGNRSIIANPTIPGMKDRINNLVKKREGFRPFAPMVTKERQKEFFHINDDIPYMNQVVKVKEEYRNMLVSVTHVDGTARVQTVYNNTKTHSLLKEFEKLSGVPILLNTSFNIKDKTMVLTPEDAIKTFSEVDIDILVLQNFIIYKK